MTQKAKLRPVKPSDPCLICNGTHKCSRGDDGVIMCGRPIDPAPMGFVYLGLANGDDQFGLYRVKDDEKDRQWRDDRRRNGHSSRNGNGHGRSEQPPEGPTIDWDARARQYAAALTSERRHELAVVLDLPEATIASAMPLLGSTKEWDGREVWTFPEEDGEGRIIGIRRRYRKEDLKEDEKDKKSMPDAKAGITVLEGWDRGGPFFGPEGATDNFTINAMGLTGAGRPSNTGGGEHLAHFLRDFPPDRRIIILGENDKKADGKWPGLEGAKSTAAKLSESLGRKVDWCLTPNGAKDARAWAKTQIADREDMDAWSDAGEKFAQACLDQLDDDEEEADVDDFAPDESTFRPFPLATLPEPIRSYVEAGAASVNCDPSFVALPMLTTLAAAIGNSRRIQLKKGWSEPAIIWTGIIGESGTTKSPAIDLAKEFPLARQMKAEELFEERQAAYEVEKAKHKIAEAEWKEQLKTDPDAKKPDEPIAPVMERALVDDTTIEAVGMILKENWRGTLVLRDELAGWLGAFDKYSKSPKGGGDAAKWIEMFGGRSMTIDRRHGVPRRLFIPRAATGVSGGVQPKIFRRLATDEHRDSGLIARLLTAWPPRRPRRWTDATVDDSIRDAVQAVYTYLWDELKPGVRDGKEQPVLVPLQPDAKDEFVRFVNNHGIEQFQLDGDLAAVWSKRECYAARIALVHHAVRCATGERNDPEAGVDVESIRAGIEMVRWFCTEDRRVYAMLTEDPAEADRRAIVGIIHRNGGEISARELERRDRCYRPIEKAETALADLVQKKLAVRVEQPPGRKGGRPTWTYRLL